MSPLLHCICITLSGFYKHLTSVEKISDIIMPKFAIIIPSFGTNIANLGMIIASFGMSQYNILHGPRQYTARTYAIYCSEHVNIVPDRCL